MSTPRQPIESIEDNYEAYFLHAAGWQYDAWDRFTQSDLHAHDQTRRASTEALLVWSSEVPWHLWFKAQALMQRALYEACIDAGVECLGKVTPEDAPLLHVEDMARVLLDVAILHAPERVGAVAQAWRARAVEAKTELEGCLSWAEGGSQDALVRWAAQQPDEAEAQMDVAQLMWRWGRAKEAAQWLERARASSPEDAPVRIDIELLQARLRQLDEVP